MKALQLIACVSYLGVGALYFFISTHPADLLATLVILAVSFVVMVARAVYAHSTGLWVRDYPWSIAAAQPERTAVVTLGILFLTAFVGVLGGFDTPSNDQSVGIIVTLFLTGGLFTAVITSPHALVELQATAPPAPDDAERAEVSDAASTAPTTRTLYPSPDDIPDEQLPFLNDAAGRLRLCNDCYWTLIDPDSSDSNTVYPEAGELCVGCAWRSAGPIRDSLAAAVDQLVAARMVGATAEDVSEALSDVEFFVAREHWKNAAAPPPEQV